MGGSHQDLLLGAVYYYRVEAVTGQFSRLQPGASSSDLLVLTPARPPEHSVAPVLSAVGTDFASLVLRQPITPGTGTTGSSAGDGGGGLLQARRYWPNAVSGGCRVQAVQLEMRSGIPMALPEGGSSDSAVVAPAPAPAPVPTMLLLPPPLVPVSSSIRIALDPR